MVKKMQMLTWEELQKHRRNKSKEKPQSKKFKWDGDFVVKIEEEE